MQGRATSAKDGELDRRLTRGELDAKQDQAADVLVTKLAGDGFSRTQPFKAFGGPAASRLKELDDLAEATLAQKIARNVRRHKDTSPASKKAAQHLATAALAVVKATKTIAPAATESALRRRQRDALIAEWTKSYALLRLAAAFVEASGGEPLRSTLFAHQAKKTNGTQPVAPVVAPPPPCAREALAASSSWPSPTGSKEGRALASSR